MVAICLIGLVTAFISDLASLFGCVAGLEDAVTAITFVALGTSLPDTFASKSAAISDDTADASIGNVTGSNSVNVFLGLGLPWTIAAFYWNSLGATDEWHRRFGGPAGPGDNPFVPNMYAEYPGGAFVVPAGDLAFSVTVFCVCACSCIGLIMYRRHAYGAELGGPPGPQKLHAAIMIGLWLLYVVLSCLKSYGKI